MKRNLLSIIALTGLGLTAQAAIPITSYESTAVEIPEDYAVQGGYNGFALGYNHVGANDMGASWVPDITTPDNLFPLPDLITNSSAGYSLMLTSGYRMYRWRFEAELGYRSNKAKSVSNLTYDTTPPPAAPTFTTTGNINATGNTTVISLMGNILYDRYYQSGWMWMIGGGLGGARINYDAGIDAADLAAIPTDPAFSQFNKKTIVPAAQAILGIGYTWSDHIETALTYRYFYPMNSRYWNDGTYISGRTVEFNPQYRAQTINLEIRFT